MTAELARHIGHHARLLDTTRLRCDDCTQTVLLPAQAGFTSTSSGSPIPGPDDPECAAHGRHTGTCRGCAADTKAAPDLDEHGRRETHRPMTADVAARAAEARAQLPTRKPDTHRLPPVDDDARMAEARAEIAARRPAPIPEDIDA